MKILLTGGTGFIGSYTYKELRKMGHEVQLFKGDIAKTSDWQKNLKGGETIFLIAGVRTETDIDFAVNTDSIKKLFEIAVREQKLPKRLILASSQAVYMGNVAPFNESQEPLPTTTYGQSKLLGERIAEDLCREFGIPLVIFRYSTVLGKGVREKSKMSGPLFIWTKAALNNAPMKVFQDGNQSRDYIHVGDVASANILAIDLPSGVYNVGGGESVRLIELVNWIKEASGSSSEVVILGGESSKSDPREMLSDTAKIKSYGWKTLKSAKEAVLEFVASLK